MRAEPVRLEFQGSPLGFRDAFRALLVSLEHAIADVRVRRRVELVFEEIAANIVRYAGATDAPAAVSVALDFTGGAITMTFEDDGRPFDPTSLAEPVPAESLEEARVGGLGFAMVRRLARRIEYRRTSDSLNRLVVSISTEPVASVPQ